MKVPLTVLDFLNRAAVVYPDRVAIVDQGKLTALDSPSKLIATHGGHTRIQFNVGDVFDGESLSCLKGVESIQNSDNFCSLEVSSNSAIVEIVKKLDAMGQGLDSFKIEAPTLEDVFLNITGREVRD